MSVDKLAKKGLVNLAFIGKMSSDDANGSFDGGAAGIGNMDRTGDVIAPKAFNKKCIETFLQRGFIAKEHDWRKAIAMPTACKEVGNILEVSAKFHSTPDAQAERVIMAERLDAGLYVGLSVGFWPDRDQCAWFETGKALYDHCQKASIEVDKDSILAWKGYCRLIGNVKELAEFSITLMGANPIADVSAVKGLGEDLDLSFEDQLALALDAVGRLVERSESIIELRSAGGRSLSTKHLGNMHELKARLGSIIGTMEQPFRDELELLQFAIEHNIVNIKEK